MIMYKIDLFIYLFIYLLYFKDGTAPAHTKPGFTKLNILSVHGVIVKNALIFMHKIKYFPNMLPISVRDTIASNSPTAESYPSHETCEAWLDNFGNSYHRKSIFFKGPLLSIDSNISSLVTPTTLFSINSYKSNVKRFLLKQQCGGDDDEWQAQNFVLYNISGLRKSARH